MNARGGCCIARYAGGGGMYGMSKVEKIMLKFRPIAPKPVAAGSGSGRSTAENGDGYVKCRRGKRKYVRVSGNKNKKEGCSCVKRKASAVSSAPPPPEDAVVTLSLLPEIPDRREISPMMKVRKCEDIYKKNTSPGPVWLSFNNEAVVDVPPPPPPRRPPVVSYVTVESVADCWVKSGGVSCTDMEDTCPVFISDGQDRVVWTNKAYKQMAVGGLSSGGVADEITVVLVRKDKWTAAPVTYPAFTCKVKVTSGTQGHRKTSSPPCSTQTLPCDVWQMDGGGYAWRLDVKAALCLGR